MGSKLSDPKTGQKHFWTAYKKIINKKVNTNIPPIIENGVYISNCKQKADIFNQYFANQCTINDNGSVLPNSISKIDASSSHVSVTKSQIVNIINNFNSNKAHGCDGISVAMLKLCASEVMIVLILASFQILGSMPMYSLFTKKKTIKQKAIIAQSPFYLFVAKF